MARDYKAEYRRRVERAAARGLSRSEARGHPRPGEIAPKAAVSGRSGQRLRAGLRTFLKGGNLSASAKSAGVSAERLRRLVGEQHLAERRGGRLHPIIREMQIFSRGRERTVKLGFNEASRLGSYLNAVQVALPENKIDQLVPFIGVGVTDLNGKRHPFETDLNTLYELQHSGHDIFENVYRLTVI